MRMENLMLSILLIRALRRLASHDLKPASDDGRLIL
jgi:hypothetical protein